VEQLVAEYRTWLVVDRGLTAPTVLRYENLARRFLGQQTTVDGDQVAVDLTAADVVGFLLRESERVRVGAVKSRVAELRSLLRFLYLKGGYADRPGQRGAAGGRMARHRYPGRAVRR
jgi:hypothetical protein